MLATQHLANVPLEQLSVAKEQAVTRVPSLSVLHHLLRTHLGDGSPGGQRPSLMQQGVDPDSVFYIISPDGDLKQTEDLFLPFFRNK